MGRVQLPVLASELMACLVGAVMSQLVYNGLSSFGAHDVCVPAALTVQRPRPGRDHPAPADAVVSRPTSSGRS